MPLVCLRGAKIGRVPRSSLAGVRNECTRSLVAASRLGDYNNGMQSRRVFLRWVAGAVVVGGAGCSGGGVGPEAIGDVNAGNVKDVPVGTLRAIGTRPVCIARDGAGVYAMTLTCTHAGCNIAASGEVFAPQIVCGCHGSIFDTNGNVVQGPATDPLQHFAVTVDMSGELTIHGGQSVDAGARLKV